MTNPLGRLAEWITGVVESLGYVGVAVLIAFEEFFPPIPSELILPLAGYLTGQGRLWYPGVVAAATAGSLVGALGLYAIGAKLGEERLRRIVDRHGRWLALSGEDLDRADAWFDRHGPTAVLLGRLVPVVRSLVAVPAGLRRMPLGRFVLYTTIGSGVWNSVLVGLGWALGERWESVQDYARFLEIAVLPALGVGVVRFLRRRRTRARADDR